MPRTARFCKMLPESSSGVPAMLPFALQPKQAGGTRTKVSTVYVRGILSLSTKRPHLYRGALTRSDRVFMYFAEVHQESCFMRGWRPTAAWPIGQWNSPKTYDKTLRQS